MKLKDSTVIFSRLVVLFVCVSLLAAANASDQIRIDFKGAVILAPNSETEKPKKPRTEVERTRKGPPRLMQSNYVRRHTVRAGARLRLPCPVEASPSALVHWEKDGDLVRLGWDRYRVRPDDNSLMIRDLQMDDTGVFKCHATNGFGSIDVSYLVYVLVDANAALPSDFDESFFEEMHQKGVAPQFTRPDEMRSSSRLVLTTGQTTRLHCRASGRPRVNVLWFKDNKMLSSDSSLLSEDFEVISNDRSTTIRHSVHQQQRAKRSDDDVTKLRQQQRMTTSATLRHRVVPSDVTLQGFEDEEQLDNEDEDYGNADDDRLMLRLERVTTQDSGSYTCRVFNKAGSINFTYSVQVVEPVPVRHFASSIVAPYPTNVTVIAGETALLRCHISSSSTPRVQWLRRIEMPSDGDVSAKSRIDGGGEGGGESYAVMQRPNGRTDVGATSTEGLYRSTLTINDVSKQDAGFYVCSVSTSDGGELTWRMYLSVIADGASHLTLHSEDSQHRLSIMFACVVSLTCCFAVLGLVTLACIVIRHRRHQYSNNVTSSHQRSKFPALSPMATAVESVGGGDCIQRACTTPLITSFRLPPPPLQPPDGHTSNYKNERAYEHHYDVLEYRAASGLPQCMAGLQNHHTIASGKTSDFDQIYASQNGGYSPWPLNHVTHYSTSSHAGSGLIYYDRR